MKISVIYKAGSIIKHETFETYAEAVQFKNELIAEGCEAVVRVK